jgi:hypothetical protein
VIAWTVTDEPSEIGKLPLEHVTLRKRLGTSQKQRVLAVQKMDEQGFAWKLTNTVRYQSDLLFGGITRL